MQTRTLASDFSKVCGLVITFRIQLFSFLSQPEWAVFVLIRCVGYLTQIAPVGVHDEDFVTPVNRARESNMVPVR